MQVGGEGEGCDGEPLMLAMAVGCASRAATPGFLVRKLELVR